MVGHQIVVKDNVQPEIRGHGRVFVGGKIKGVGEYALGSFPFPSSVERAWEVWLVGLADHGLLDKSSSNTVMVHDFVDDTVEFVIDLLLLLSLPVDAQDENEVRYSSVEDIRYHAPLEITRTSSNHLDHASCFTRARKDRCNSFVTAFSEHNSYCWVLSCTGGILNPPKTLSRSESPTHFQRGTTSPPLSC